MDWPDPDATTYLIGPAKLGSLFAIIRVADGIDQWRSRLPHRLLIQLKVITGRQDGFPDANEGARLAAIEAQFEESTFGRALLVAFITSAHRKDLFFYAEDTSWMGEWVQAQRNQFPEREIEIRLLEEPDWSMYEYLRGVARQAHGDRVTLEELVNHGADLRESRAIDFFAYFPTGDGANAVGENLRNHDFAIDIAPVPDSSEWSLVATCRERALPEFIAMMSGYLLSATAEHGGRYDGWGAALEKGSTASGVCR
jgi:hypothetical protein